ncbi:GumC family protein [Pseudanabaena sp. PCC 6802]|uniref:GumC family protein n=1 Tax=Pseudanabaena sp. PCC 6802 TaxID=118173 RepID=UPI0003449B40|nr:hypothetical protein [Pseudanabaena sp. PCC 6802]
MNGSTSIEPSPVKGSKGSHAGLSYLFWGIIANSIIWGFGVLYLKLAPSSYTSQFSLILPGSGSGINLTLPEIGSATSSSTSPFGSSSQDPRANYQYIANDENVIEEAARSLNITPKEFGKPKSKLIDNTTILQFDLDATSPQKARDRSYALYRALTRKVSQLRAEEMTKRDVGIQATLESAQKRLQDAQRRLSEYKAKSGLNSSDQVKDLSSNIEQLRKQKAETLAQQQQVSQRLQQLSSDLGLSVQEAANAFTLNADQLFQQNLKDYNESTATLTVLRSKWGKNHPSVVKEFAKQEAAQTALMKRARILLGRDINQANLARLNLSSNSNGTGRDALFKELVTVQAERSGIVAQNETLTQQIELLESRLNRLSQKSLMLERLQRDAQIAEAVFASTLAKLDLGKTEIFAAYPLVQLISEPSLPDVPTSPKPLFVYLGASIGSILATTAFFLLYLRQRRQSKYQINTLSLDAASSPEPKLDRGTDPAIIPPTPLSNKPRS